MYNNYSYAGESGGCCPDCGSQYVSMSKGYSACSLFDVMYYEVETGYCLDCGARWTWYCSEDGNDYIML